MCETDLGQSTFFRCESTYVSSKTIVEIWKSFDFTSENPREREVRVRFVLSRKADDFNNQTVYLKLQEQVAGTAHYREYGSFPYQLRRSFTSDF